MTDTIIVLQNEREEAGTMILKEKERWEDLYTLYTTALGIETYEEWQLGQLDALIALGEYEKAYKTY